MEDKRVARSVDTSGKCCPMPMVELNLTIKKMAPGEILEVIATDPATRNDIPAWCSRTGNELIEAEAADGRFRYLVRKGG